MLFKDDDDGEGEGGNGGVDMNDEGGDDQLIMLRVTGGGDQIDDGKEIKDKDFLYTSSSIKKIGLKSSF